MTQAVQIMDFLVQLPNYVKDPKNPSNALFLPSQIFSFKIHDE